MAQYLVYRHGYNKMNQDPDQGLPEKMTVLRGDASSAEEAVRKAAGQVSVAANQRLSAETAAALDSLEGELNLKPEALGGARE